PDRVRALQDREQQRVRTEVERRDHQRQAEGERLPEERRPGLGAEDRHNRRLPCSEHGQQQCVDEDAADYRRDYLVQRPTAPAPATTPTTSPAPTIGPAISATATRSIGRRAWKRALSVDATEEKRMIGRAMTMPWRIAASPAPPYRAQASP